MLRKGFTGFVLLLALSLAFQLTGQASADAGKTIFRNYCAQCHSKDMKTKATGPALGGVEERWAEYPQEDLYAWIRNSQAMIKAGHPRAVELWEEWKPTVMNAYPNLTDDEIGSLLLYINAQYTKVPEAAIAAGGEGVEVGPKTGQYNWLYYILFGVLGALALVLTRIIGGLDKVVAAKEGLEYEEKPLLKRIFTKRVVSFLIFGLIVFGGYQTVNRAINLGRQQGYKPDQPIAFSHETHAGLHKIECQYCHDGARRSKHSVIPATNTCMNCHSAIQVGSEYGTAELTKIYASIGYDPSTGKYLEGYDDYSEDQIKEVYTKWISQNYLDEAALNELDKKGDQIVKEQWEGIKTSLTNAQKKKIQGPIEWVRIHNLPDHVYFNHAQHVKVGQVECQTCHGKIEEMAVVQQHSPLSMGWCINCHRKTEVQFEDNEYYASYEAYHDQLTSGKKEKVTVEDIGGLECQKCHY
ncbi:MAG: c-type cytochrome [Bacteroidota bacterium]